MVEVHWLSGGVWLLGGLAMCYLGYLIRFEKRVDLHSDYREGADDDRVAAWVGGIAIVMGVVTGAHGLREILFGFDPRALGVLLVVLLVLSYLTKLLARGWTPTGDEDWR